MFGHWSGAEVEEHLFMSSLAPTIGPATDLSWSNGSCTF